AAGSVLGLLAIRACRALPPAAINRLPQPSRNSVSFLKSPDSLLQSVWGRSSVAQTTAPAHAGKRRKFQSCAARYRRYRRLSESGSVESADPCECETLSPVRSILPA